MTKLILEAIANETMTDLLAWCGLKGSKQGPETTIKLYSRILQLIREGRFDFEKA